jgi:catechol 2,3-dioxygenase-like lactoylglutathione lyase family enzyme
MSIIDHINLNVTDAARSVAFYEQALAPLGIKVMMRSPVGIGFGIRKPEFWITQSRTTYQSDEQVRVITPVHVCFAAKSREEVDAFYRAALAAGGRDFGPAGRRPEYHPGYYGAFVLDPDGHNIEAVIHGASSTS